MGCSVMLSCSVVVLVLGVLEVGCDYAERYADQPSGRRSRSSYESVYYPGGPSRSYVRPRTVQTYDRSSLRSYPSYKEPARSYSKYDDRKYERVKYETPKYETKSYEYEPKPRIYVPERKYEERRYEEPKVTYRRSKTYYEPVERKSYSRFYDDGYPPRKETRFYQLRSPSKYSSYSQEKSYSRVNDPCVRKYDGQYVLSSEFRKLFPYVDNMCYFIKCANKKAFLNPCGPGTRNDKSGGGFCSHLDLEGYCGKTVYDAPEKKKSSSSSRGSYSPSSYKESTYSTKDRRPSGLYY